MTGTLFFVPTATFLEEVVVEAVPSPIVEPAVSGNAVDPAAASSERDSSLGIGSLKEGRGGS